MRLISLSARRGITTVAKFERSDLPQDDGKPTMRQVRQDVMDRCVSAGLGAEFMPVFLDHICRPFNYLAEEPQRIAVAARDGATRWSEPYRVRVMYCLGKYVGLSEKERAILKSGADEGVRWMGEDVDQYVQIWELTMQMHQSRGAFIDQAKAALGMLEGD